MAKKKAARGFRGQLMLQIAHGKYFRPGVEVHETVHRQVLYTSVRFVAWSQVDLPVGHIVGSTGHRGVNSVWLQATDRLEAQRPDGTDDYLIATGGTELLDDVAYVASFVLNRTFHHDHDLVRRLTGSAGQGGGRRDAKTFFPDLFDVDALVTEDDWERLRTFMDTLIGMNREQFSLVMRVLRRSVDATRRAIDDPTGAYVDLVASLESLSESTQTSPTTWDRYDPRKRKILDAAIVSLRDDERERVKAAILKADQAGLKRRFVSSTLNRVASSFYRDGARTSSRPPRSADLEQMLSLAYDIRSRRSHILEDLTEEAWLFTEGAETTYVPDHQTMLTLAGLWRLVRHVVAEYVQHAPREVPAPWDYRESLPGIVQMQLAPQYWVSSAGISAETAMRHLGGVVEAVIEIWAGRSQDGINLTDVSREIEALVPTLTDSEARTALVAIHNLWHSWIAPDDVSEAARVFSNEHQELLTRPSMSAFVAAALSARELPWSADEWRDLAVARRAERQDGKASPLPPSFDALLQLFAADYLEEAGRHAEAVVHAAWTVEEVPGHAGLLEWEQKLLAGAHDPNFLVQPFLLDVDPEESDSDHPGSDGPDQTGNSEPVVPDS